MKAARASAPPSSASVSNALHAASTTVVPCTWRSHKGSVGNRRASCRRRRFSSTCSGSSPTWVARLSEVYGPLLAPPRRVVVQARTVSGAGHSGTSQPSGAASTSVSGIVTQYLQYRLHVVRRRRLPLHGLAGFRMAQTQHAGMQGLTLKCMQRFAQAIAATRRQTQSAPVRGVAQQRVMDVGHVHADLMRAPRFQSHFDITVSTKTLDHTVVRHGLAPALDDGHALAIHQMTTEGRVDRAARGHHADNDRIKYALTSARLQLRHQALVRGVRARDDQETARVLVEAVHDARARKLCELGRVMQQGIHERAGPVARRGMHAEARGFADDQYGLVLVHLVERVVCAGPWELRGLDRGERHLLAAPHLVARARQGLSLKHNSEPT